MDLLLAPESRPFAVAALILIGLIGAESIAMLIGLSMSHWAHGPADHAPEHDGDSHLANAFDWLNTGRVPILVLIMLALGAFAILGFDIHAVGCALFIPLR